ncbi:MAG TPA: TetR family transcriptional regulator [Lacisediminihabitans sp.]|uniref:TetR/AcrR family transcriptional regulator n=1 Tax=Lacisediminihabitans sp. TaxID=2787631 RepID=UPI002ED9BD78
MNSDGSRGPYTKGIAKRRELLREALRAYAESGASGPSLRAVAERVGLSERGLLHYFSSRAQLLVSILAERDQALRASFSETDSIDVLLEVVESQLDTPGLARLFLEMSADSPDPAHPAHDFFVDRYSRLLPLVQSMLDRSAPADDPIEVAPSSADDLWAARMLIAAADGLQIQWLLDPSIDPRSDLDRLSRAIRRSAIPG